MMKLTALRGQKIAEVATHEIPEIAGGYLNRFR